MSTETTTAPKMTNPSCDRCRHGWDSHSDEDGRCFRCSCDQYDGEHAAPVPPAPPPPEGIDAGAEQARRDDLARDVARLWAEWQVQPSDRDRVSLPSAELQAALDRLSAAYGEQS